MRHGEGGVLVACAPVFGAGGRDRARRGALALAVFLAAVTSVGVMAGDDDTSSDAEKKGSQDDKPDKEKKEPPKPILSVTQHTATIGGAALTYTATAG